jgi:hypothetical protein
VVEEEVGLVLEMPQLKLEDLLHKDLAEAQDTVQYRQVQAEEAWVLLVSIHQAQQTQLVLEVLDFHTTHLEQILFILVVAEAERIAELLLELVELVEVVLGQRRLQRHQMELRILEEEEVVVLLCLELAIHLETADLELSS